MRLAQHQSLPVERLVDTPVRKVSRRAEQVIVIVDIPPVEPVVLAQLVIDADEIFGCRPWGPVEA